MGRTRWDIALKQTVQIAPAPHRMLREGWMGEDDQYLATAWFAELRRELGKKTAIMSNVIPIVCSRSPDEAVISFYDNARGDTQISIAIYRGSGPRFQRVFRIPYSVVKMA